MDIKEFQKLVEPKAKRSKLLPYLSQILELKSNGYSNLQITEWLKLNDIEVTQEAVRKFINNKNSEKNSPALGLLKTSTEVIERNAATNIAIETHGLSAKQIREKNADKYCPESTNPLLKRLMKDQ